MSKAASYRSQAAARFARRVSAAPTESVKLVQTAVNTATKLSNQFSQLLAILLVLFLLHQIFLWLDRDPEKAFDQGALLFEITEISWDTTSIFYNAAVDVVNAGVLPVWNAVSFYVAEPTIVLALEVFSLAFTHQHWQGLFSEADFPYNGLDCTATFKVTRSPQTHTHTHARARVRARNSQNQFPQAALFWPQSSEWCGRAAAYAARLESAEKAEGYSDASGTYAAASRRMLSNLAPLRRNATVDGFRDADDTYVFGIATARRLAELGAESNDNFVAPAFDTSAFNDAILDLGMLIITLGSTFVDVAFAVAGEILTQVFSVLVDSFFFLLRSVMMVLKMLVSAPFATPTTRAQPLGSHLCARGRVRHAHDRHRHRCRLCDHRAKRPLEPAL